MLYWLWLYSTIEYESKRLAMGAGVNIKNDWPGVAGWACVDLIVFAHACGSKQ